MEEIDWGLAPGTIDIPLGKALVPVEGSTCRACVFYSSKIANEKSISACRDFDCAADDREDGKNVVYRIIDWPQEGKKNE